MISNIHKEIAQVKQYFSNETFEPQGLNIPQLIYSTRCQSFWVDTLAPRKVHLLPNCQDSVSKQAQEKCLISKLKVPSIASRPVLLSFGADLSRESPCPENGQPPLHQHWK